ncbi:MAG TPA: response regulator [Polyangia bacterium]|nr:response regulator [Polyangia bacterium]
MAKDPYEYFRVEAREILDELGRGVLQIEKGATPQVAAALLRLAHTLKGAARVVRHKAIAEQAHAIEEALAPLREPGAVVARPRIDQVLALVDAISAEVSGLGASKDAVTAPEPQPRAADDGLRTIRAAVAELDALLDGVGEASVHLRSLRRTASAAEQARRLADLLAEHVGPARGGEGHAAAAAPQTKARSLLDELRRTVSGLERSLTVAVEQADRELSEVRDAAERLRLVPVDALFTALERVTRDSAQAIGKDASFTASGGDVKLEGHVLGIVQGAVIQLVRNAVAHGIESPTERARVGKPPTGRVELEVARRGSRVTFSCRDDGRGIDFDAVRRVAEARGLLAPGSGPRTADELLRLLLKGGLTTAGAVTHVSGRGIGLDVVREAAARLGGDVTVETVPGRGTTLTLVVPLSLSALDALLVEAGEVSAVIPLDAVRRTLRLDEGDVTRSSEGDSIVYEGKLIPFAPLARALSLRASPPRLAGPMTAVVIGGAADLAAVGVSRLRGVANVVVRPLPSLAPAAPLVAGAALDADGTPQLVLDPAGMIAEARRGGVSLAPQAPPTAAAVLVIDDSLTTRMMEQSILESAGYEVDLATSAEEGLEKARQRRYQLFLVDVEMPGMDGFSFVQRTRADPDLRGVPAILVTSRNAPEDRRRGVEAGASDYIVKGDFDQKQLLATIRRLVGA